MSIGQGEVTVGSVFSRQEGPHVSKEGGVEKAEEGNRRQEVGRASPCRGGQERGRMRRKQEKA